MTDTNKPWFYYYAVNMCTRQSLSAIARGGPRDARPLPFASFPFS